MDQAAAQGQTPQHQQHQGKHITPNTPDTTTHTDIDRSSIHLL